MAGLKKKDNILDLVEKRAFIIIVVKKRQLFGAICASFKFIIYYIIFMLNFSPLEQYLVFQFQKYNNKIYMLNN